MNDQEYNDLRETNWQRPLTTAESAQLEHYLAANPEARESWETDRQLDALLGDLPAAPKVSSNFTSQVLQAVERDRAAQCRTVVRGTSSLWQRLQGWLPRTALALLLVTSVFFVYHQREVTRRAALAQNVAELTHAVSASGPDLMQDFESIRHLDDSQSKADTELLALFK